MQRPQQRSSSQKPQPESKDEEFHRPLAVRGKFIFDAENGGGRRRRERHLPREKLYMNLSKGNSLVNSLNFDQRVEANERGTDSSPFFVDTDMMLDECDLSFNFNQTLENQIKEEDESQNCQL